MVLEIRVPLNEAWISSCIALGLIWSDVEGIVSCVGGLRIGRPAKAPNGRTYRSSPPPRSRDKPDEVGIKINKSRIENNRCTRNLVLYSPVVSIILPSLIVV